MSKLEDQFNREIDTRLSNQSRRPASGALKIDTERYQQYLDDPKLTPTEKEQILSSLWSIVVTFVELGFEVHPVQKACGKAEKPLDEATELDSTEVQLRSGATELQADAPEV